MSLEELRELIVETIGCDEDSVVPEATFAGDLMVDSLSMLELAMALEEKTGKKIPDEDLPKIKTVQDALDYFED
ncbi:MAG: acyl carrier protein [Lachnospiraceae bacterium]|nr:acyl carrier protein [Lachnospiraceae bacterium]